ncbi:MAG: DUF389 domain-containing protein [Asticcacaulis sp.]
MTKKANWRRRLRPEALRRRVSASITALIRRPSELCTPYERAMIEHQVHEDAKLSAFYYLMLVSACGIATIGLMQSSVAVLIGAMLISPLMAPIMAMGMALARLEFRAFRDASFTLLVGTVVSILAGILIVWISPLKEVTPEILARTRPTLLDLGVAALSGVVGAYVTISRKGGVIAGVAIATALLPPLNVVGFGIATGSASMAGGAFLLFLTNVVAILGAVFAVSRRYGFVPHHMPETRWETVAILAALAIICAPLALSLKDIVSEARMTNQVRADLDTAFRAQASRISDLRVNVRGSEVRGVNAIVITQDYVPGVETTLRQKYKDAREINVEQVLAAKDTSLLSSPRASGSPASPTGDAFLNQIISRVANVESTSRQGKRLDLQVRLKNGGDLGDYYSLEQAIQRLMPDDDIRLIPPVLAVEPLRFKPELAALSDTGTIEQALWAARRWNAPQIQIIIPATDNRPALARQRLEAVNAAFAAANTEDGPTVSISIANPTQNGTNRSDAIAQNDPPADIFILPPTSAKP